jgi:hypothetical protein
MRVLTKRRSSNSVLRSWSSSVLRRRRRSSSVLSRSSNVLRRLRLSVCQGRLRGATWLLLLLCPHGKRIGF